MKQKLLFLLTALMLLTTGNAWGASSFLTTWTGSVGLDNSADFTYATKSVQIAPGETYVYTLTNFNDGTNNLWHNWVVEGNNGGKYFDCCANGDNWQAGGGPQPSYTPVINTSDVADWMSKYNGAAVTITISRNAEGTGITVTHTSNVLGTTTGNTDKYYGGTYTMTVGAEETWNVYITERYSHFVVTSVTYTDVESNVTDYNPIYQRGYTTAWSSGDIASGKWVRTGGNAGNVSATASDGLKMDTYQATLTNSSISYTNGNILKYDIIWNTGASYGTNNEAYLKIGDAVTFATSSQGQYGRVTIGSNDAINIPNACNSTNGNRDGDVWTIHMEVNTTTNKVTNLVIKGNKGTTKVNYSLASDKSFSPASFSSAQIGLTRASSASSLWCAIKSINIDQEAYSAPTAIVTYKYEDTSGNSLSEYHADAIISEAVGTAFSNLISGDLIATFYNGTSHKYVYADNYEVEGDYTVVQAGGNTVTLKFTDYPTTAYTVNAQVGGANLTTLASGTAYFDGSTSAFWNKYINVSDQWYVADETNYGATITAATTNVAFTATDAINYFYEFEDLNISSSYNNPTGETRFSNGAAKTLGANGANAKTTSAIAAGVYTISMYGLKWADKDDNYRVSYSTNGTDWVTLGDISYGKSEEGLKSLSGAIIPTASYIKFETTGGSQTPRRYMDYITFEKTAELPATVSKTITSAKWATYCSPYILDFSSAIENLTAAYIVTDGNDGVLTLEEVDGTVPANTGLLLKGEGNCVIPVAASSSTNVDDNKLVGVTSNTPLTAGSGYVLMASPKLGFYKNANAFTVGANTAYLPIDFDENNTGARSAFFGFDENVTGINAIEATETEAGALKDGKYLIGNKIVLVKNGMKYDANGKKLN